METFFQPIASSQTLQAIAILVTLATLIFYLLKYGWRALRFVIDVATGKWKSAVLRISRKSVRSAAIDYVDARLIVIRLSLFSLLFGLLLLQMLIVLIGTVQLLLIFEPEPINFSWPNGVLSIVGGFLVGLAVSSFVLFGVVRHFVSYAVYIRIVRRMIARQRLASHRKSTKK